MYVRVTYTYNAGIGKYIAGYFDTTGGPHFVWVSGGGDTLWTGIQPTSQSMKITPTAVNSYTYYDSSVWTTPTPDDSVGASWTSPASATTVAMVCDSMVKYINDHADYQKRYVAYDSTTFYVIVCERGPGARFLQVTSANQDTLTLQTVNGNSPRDVISLAVVTDTSRSYTGFTLHSVGGTGRDLTKWESAYPCTAFTYADSIDLAGNYPLNYDASAGRWNHIDLTVVSPSDWLMAVNLTKTTDGTNITLHHGEMWLWHSYDRGATWQDSSFVMQFNPDDTEWDSKYLYKWAISSIEQRAVGFVFRTIYSAKDSANSHWHTGRTLIYVGHDTTETNLTTYVTGVANDTADALRDGDTWTGVHDFGGATSLEIPNGNNPSTTVEGQISADLDDDALEVTDGTNDMLIPYMKKMEALIWNPDLITDTVPIFFVDSALYQGGIEIVHAEIQASEDALTHWK
jgi:hypothetical protein